MFPSIDVIPWVCPDVMVLGLACLLGLPLLVLAWVARPGSEPWADSRMGRFAAILHQWPMLIAAWTLVAGVAVWQYMLNFNPRYLAMALPLLVLLVSALLMVVVRKRWIVSILFLDVIVFNLANTDGAYYPSLSEVLDRYPMAYYLRERSHLFVESHKSDCDAMRFLEANYSDHVIYTEPPYGFYLALPQLGVVQKPLRGYCYGIRSDFMPAFRHKLLGNVPPAAGQNEILIVGRVAPRYDPPSSPSDVIKRDAFDPPLVIYKKAASVPVATPSPGMLSADWKLATTSPADATTKASSEKSVRLEIVNPGDAPQSILLSKGGLSWRFGRRYRLEFRMRSDRRRTILVELSPDPRSNLLNGDQPSPTWTRTIELDRAWSYCCFEFVANADTDQGTIRVAAGGDPASVEIADMAIR